jgi:hypothetical protein
MHRKFIAAASVALAFVSAPALVHAAAPMTAVVAFASEEVTDAQLISFNEAMQKVRGIAAAAGGAPTAEQQAEMAAAIEASGLGIEQFNAVSTKVSSDAVLRARLGVLAAPASAEGSVAAGVTDAEVGQFSAAMARIREVAPAGGAAPTDDQQAAMAAAVSNSGLTLERFNEVATAVSQDARLRARVELADAQRG